MIEETINGAQVLGDGNTVWVNTDAGAIGRFSKTRIDIHSPSNTSCAVCGPTGADLEDAWLRFKKGMRVHHDIRIPEIFRPSWVAGYKTKSRYV